MRAVCCALPAWKGMELMSHPHPDYCCRQDGGTCTSFLPTAGTNSAARLSHTAVGVEPSGVCATKPCRDLPLNTQVCLISSFSVFRVLLLFSFSVVLAGRALLCEGATRWLGSSYGSFYTLTLSLAVESQTAFVFKEVNVLMSDCSLGWKTWFCRNVILLFIGLFI